MATKHATHTLPSLSVLFKESWVTFKGSVLNLFILNIVSFALYIALFIITLIACLPFGIISIATSISADKLTPAAVSSIGAIGVILLISVVVGVIISFMVQAGSVLFVGNAKSKPEFGSTFKKGLSFVLRLFLLGIVIGLLTSGAYLLFVIPGIILSILFAFAPYEVVLNKKGPISAIRRSIRVVSSHFWGVLGRMLLWVGIVITLSILPNMLLGTRGGASGLPFVFVVLNVLLGWYGLCYAITLYKQAEGATTAGEAKLLWPVIISIVGWVVGLVLLVATIGLIVTFASEFIKAQENKPTKKIKTYQMENIYYVNPTEVPFPSTSIVTPTTR